MDSVSFLMRLFLHYGGRLNRTNLMKLVFVAQRAIRSRWFDFVPMRRGGYSFVLERACEKLTEQGLLAREEKCYCLTHSGFRFAEETPPDSELSSFLHSLDRFGKMDGESYNGLFIAYIYGIAPEFAVNSVILDDLSRYDMTLRQRVADIRKRNQKRLKNAPILTTIGYEGHSLDRYLRILLSHAITLLIDVRKNPISRCFGFSKSRLMRACQEVGIEYRHLPNLGIASEKRRALYTQADYNALFEEYERTVLPNATEELQTIVNLLNAGERVALTCFEANALQCHRTRIANRITQMCGIAALSL